MNEITTSIQTPVAEVMRMALANRILTEERDTARKVNAVLMNEIDGLEKALAEAEERIHTLRAERDDARHERNALRDRRDRAYEKAICLNRAEQKTRGKRMRRFAARAFCAAFSAVWLFALGSKAVAWIGYWLGR